MLIGVFWIRVDRFSAVTTTESSGRLRGGRRRCRERRGRARPAWRGTIRKLRPSRRTVRPEPASRRARASSGVKTPFRARLRRPAVRAGENRISRLLCRASWLSAWLSGWAGCRSDTVASGASGLQPGPPPGGRVKAVAQSRAKAAPRLASTLPTSGPRHRRISTSSSDGAPRPRRRGPCPSPSRTAMPCRALISAPKIACCICNRQQARVAHRGPTPAARLDRGGNALSPRRHRSWGRVDDAYRQAWRRPRRSCRPRRTCGARFTPALRAFFSAGRTDERRRGPRSGGSAPHPEAPARSRW
jgi:hypothetical protein